MAASAAAVFLVACGGGAAPEPARPATEEVPVGYGTRPGADVTGAVRSVPEAELEAGGHFTDVLEFLQGRVAGLQVVDLGGGNVSLRIRGVNQSLQERYLEPLLVIDEMPVAAGNVGVALRALRPQDVSSVQVLKDVSSTAIYGTRGANGVILIRLRRG
jgi:TonB-dependent SusC/RagA subfamily outer membrane receptor